MKTTAKCEFGWGLHKLCTMDHYALGEDVTFLLMQWLGRHLLRMSTPPFELVVLGDYTIDYENFVALTLHAPTSCIRSTKKVSSSKS
jgi:hypothetical protein